MTAETVDAKGRRLYEGGRVTISRIVPRLRIVTVQGDSGAIHTVCWTYGNKEWRCSCPARRACSHCHAAQLAIHDRLPESAVWWHPARGEWRERQSP